MWLCCIVLFVVASVAEHDDERCSLTTTSALVKVYRNPFLPFPLMRTLSHICLSPSFQPFNNDATQVSISTILGPTGEIRCQAIVLEANCLPPFTLFEKSTVVSPMGPVAVDSFVGSIVLATDDSDTTLLIKNPL